MVAEGERVQLTRPMKDGKRNKVANREMGTIEQLNQVGDVRVKVDSGRTMDWNFHMMPPVEYAYGMASYSLQSKTSQRTLMQIDTGD